MSDPSGSSAVDRVDSALLEAAGALLRAKERSVLLVEDTAAHAAIIRRTLEQAGWMVQHETRASAAIEAFEADPSRIVLLDLTLPDMPGINLLSRLRSSNERAAIIVVTAMDNVSTSVEAMQKGAWDYVVKEDPGKLAARLGSVVLAAWRRRLNEAQEKLVEQTRIRELVKAQRLEAIELVVRTVCHEVNNPLSGVVALSQLLQQSSSLDQEVRKLADGIVDSAQQVRRAIDKLRSIDDSVIEFGGQKILDSAAEPQKPR